MHTSPVIFPMTEEVQLIGLKDVRNQLALLKETCKNALPKVDPDFLNDLLERQKASREALPMRSKYLPKKELIYKRRHSTSWTR